MFSYSEIAQTQDHAKTKFDICPYCGHRMLITIGGRLARYSGFNQNDRVYYRCPRCGSTSPWIFLSECHLDEDKVKEALFETVDRFNDEELDDDFEEDCE